ncbi:helix-turn-helix transcriptional regulator [Roseibium sp.]|uniref:helix-turn-helix transcriptional regulator n=1 Tax=Roseibium sp. TaxID=1936156 RepID=UPI003A96C1EF
MPRANKQLRNLRLQAGLSQNQLARRAGLVRTTISKAESGSDVKLRTISEIISALSDLLGREVRLQEVITANHHERPSLDSFDFPDFARDRIRRRMFDIAISTEELAYRANVSRATINRILNGRVKTRRQTLARIAAALDFTWDALMEPPRDEIINMQDYLDRDPDIEPNPKRNLAKVAESIPEQNPLIRFEVSPGNKLKLVPSLDSENDYGIIEALRSELLASNGPIETLKERYATNPNLPQSSLFKPLTEGYDKELSKDPKDINYAVLYARGARFYAARRTAAQQVTSNEWPELGADEADAIDAICDLHGPLIMASSVGRQMVSDAYEYETTPDVYRKEQEIVEELGQVITTETEIFEAETVDDIQALTPPIENDPQPARTRRAGILVAGSVLTVVVGGAAWLAGGSTALYFAVPAAAGYWGQKYVWEVLKKTNAFKDSSDADAKSADAWIKQAEEQIGPHQQQLMERMSQLIERQRPLFEKIASMRPEFGWAKKFLGSSENEITALPETGESGLRETSDEDWHYSVSIDNLPNQIVVDSINATKGSDVFQVQGRRSVNGPGHIGEYDDRLFYEIAEGGRGFSINPINGRVTLSSPTPTGGIHSMTIRVNDEQSPPNTAQGTLQVRIQK